ncbi:aspartate aminotransferase family protein [Limnovirga soli]|uniref:Aminotransferase class III-fold pyridoxal phosphate-dependent enzyme n=1 Tax=Limnovirga soli TaxID=2656915 RepID=A0A8J8JW24_9BACT|nr:aspartate aminotransferase family protein [Limnovirga soli]NNV54876.1 aminotransferase class III-fold pyridoxal phosphate-dependent enzyme [Limnovirga soli]
MYTYEASAKLLERAKQSLAGGVSSEFRKYNHPHAIFYTHANGSRIYDVDGNEYIDFTLSQGPMLVGHNHPHVVKRVEEYAKNGQLYAGQHVLEIELAEKLQQIIPCAELMRFCLDGSEAVQTAFRVARAKTGKPKFIRFEGHYHGWLDNVAWGLSTPSIDDLGSREHPNVFPWTAGLPAHTADDFITLPWNDATLLRQTIQEKHHEIAAIITEPIMCNNGCILPIKGYLQEMRELCSQYDIALIFDEVITGFRTALGGAQSYFNIVPDLAIFAKAMASGYPISAIVGKRDWMQLIANGTVIHAGTMNSSNSTIAAAIGTLEVLEAGNCIEHIYTLGQQLMEGLRDIAKNTNNNILVQGLGPMLHTGFTQLPAVKDFRDVLTYDKVKLGKFIAGMHDNGIRVIGRGLWYISAAHTTADIEQALTVASTILKQI